MRPSYMIFSVPDTWQGNPITTRDFFQVLRDAGLEGVDIFPPVLETVEGGAVQLRALLDEVGLETACYYRSLDLIDPERESEVNLLFDEAVAVCAALGCRYLFTHGSQHRYEGDENRRRYIEQLRGLVDRLEGTGLTLVIENAGLLMHSVAQMREVLEGVDREGLRLALDSGNFYLWHQDEVAAFGELLPYTVHLHVKDYVNRRFEGKNPKADGIELGRGEVRHGEILELLRNAAYRGWMAYEKTMDGDDALWRSLKLTAAWCRA